MHSKLLLIIILLLIYSQTALSQKKFSVGLTFSPAFTIGESFKDTINTNNLAQLLEESRGRIGHSTGLRVELNPIKWVSLIGTISHQVKKYKINDARSDFYLQKLNVESINVPLMVGLNLKISDFRVYANTGINNSIFYRYRLSRKTDEAGQEQVTIIYKKADQGVKRFSFSSLSSIGLGRQFASQAEVIVQGDFEYSLGTLVKNAEAKQFPYSFGITGGINLWF